MLNKHKLFLLCAKWIPVVTAIGILVTNTIAYYGCNDIVVDIFNFNIGTSVAGVILMYVCSYAFNFCIWHKLVITYNALIIAIVFIIRYCITECSYSYLLLSYYILAGIILLLILYIHSKKIISLMEKTNCLLDAVKNQLQNAISNIDAGNSNLNEEEYLLDNWSPIYNSYIETFDNKDQKNIEFIKMLYDSRIKIADSWLEDAINLLKSEEFSKDTIVIFVCRI